MTQQPKEKMLTPVQEDGEVAPEREHMLPVSEQMGVMIDPLPIHGCTFKACGKPWYVDEMRAY